MKNNNLYSNNFIIKEIEKDIKNNINIKIKTRFPPEPSGNLHIGHVKSIFLNFLIASRYNGECNLRYDDTNPSNISEKYINSIKYDIDWLGFKNKYNICYSSDYFNKIFLFAIKLIKKNLAYVDELNCKDIRLYKGYIKNLGINSPYRYRSIDENINLFIKMKDGFFKENEVCLRAKINMKSPSILMRDPVLYRIKFIKHNRTGYKWCIYPTYDFSHCICDFIENITHSLCTTEFIENKLLYNWVLNNIDVLGYIPKQYEFSKLNIEYNVLSKRKINFLIKNNIISGWDDPRIFTISGLRNRGYTPNSIINFCKNLGVTKKNNLIKINNLEFYIKNDLYNNSKRIMSVINPIRIFIENLDNNYIEKILVPNYPNIKKNKSYRKIYFSNSIFIEKSDFCECNKKICKKFSIGKIIKLRYSYIIYAKSIKFDINNNKYIICSYYKNTNKSIFINNFKVKNIIHWVSCKYNIKSVFYIYENIFNEKNPNKFNNLLDIINYKSLIIKYGFIEKSNKKINKGTYQFERIGYFNTNLEYENNYLKFYNVVNI